MSMTYVAGVSNAATGSGTTLDCSATLHVEIGDLLIGVGVWEDTSRVGTIADSDGSTNVLTMLTLAAGPTTKNYMRFGWKVADTHVEAETFRLTLNGAATYRAIMVMQFRPDAGDTLSVEAGPSPVAGSSTASSSGDITVSEADNVVVSCHKNWTIKTYSGILIGGAAVTGTVTPTGGWACMSYMLGVSGTVDGDATLSANADWLSDILAIKSIAAEEGGEFELIHVVG
jgi:hypothetical protein